MPLSRLTGGDLSRAYGEMLAPGGRRNGRGALSPRSVRLVHVAAHRALKDAARWGYITRNVADDADPPRQPGRVVRFWTPDQLQQFVDTAKAERWLPAFLVAATTGLRRGEIAGLRWTDLDLDAGALTVSRARVVVGGEAVASDPKTARGHRRIALDRDTVATLKAWRRQQAEERLTMGAGWADLDGHVFCWPDGTLVHPEVLTKTFGRIVKQARLPKLTLHGLRHTWATSALQAGVPVRVVADRLGHSGVQVTLDVYTGHVPGLDQQAADTVAGLLLPSSVTNP